jgi:hypothetical protein
MKIKTLEQLIHSFITMGKTSWFPGRRIQALVGGQLRAPRKGIGHFSEHLTSRSTGEPAWSETP